MTPWASLALAAWQLSRQREAGQPLRRRNQAGRIIGLAQHPHPVMSAELRRDDISPGGRYQHGNVRMAPAHVLHDLPPGTPCGMWQSVARMLNLAGHASIEVRASSPCSAVITAWHSAAGIRTSGSSSTKTHTAPTSRMPATVSLGKPRRVYAGVKS